MGLELRTGTYGEYWGNTYNSSNTMTIEQMKINAEYLYRALVETEQFTLNALCGMLGNMQSESAINPREMAKRHSRRRTRGAWIWFSSMDSIHKIH